MDPRSTSEQDSGNVPHSPDAGGGTGTAAAKKNSDVRFPAEDGGKSLAEMAQRDLTATLQLLAERAQYITGATGAAIALRDQDEMVCRASSGPSAPEVGAQLQIDSGLSGESVRTRQTLRCDDAFTDSRVNRESCEALGIRSVVVMPLLRGEEVIGVFELFSDKANVFETRDLVALERMGTMVHTALEHSTAALGLPPMLGEAIQPMRASQASRPLPQQTAESDEDVRFKTELSSGVDLGAASSQAISAPPRPGIAFHGRTMQAAGPAPAAEVPQAASMDRVPKRIGTNEEDILEETATTRMPTRRVQSGGRGAALSFEALLAQADQDPILSDVDSAPKKSSFPVRASPGDGQSTTTVEAGPLEKEHTSLPVGRTAVASLKKCQECGFPVSEGRRLCLDCEKKKVAGGTVTSTATTSATTVAVAPAASPNAEPVSSPAPTFMHSEAAEASWFSTHKFMIIALALAAIGVVAVVVLR